MAVGVDPAAAGVAAASVAAEVDSAAALVAEVPAGAAPEAAGRADTNWPQIRADNIDMERLLNRFVVDRIVFIRDICGRIRDFC